MSRKLGYWVFFCVLIFGFYVSGLFAGFFTNSTGVNGGQFLKIPMNARIVALGENGTAKSGFDFSEFNPAVIYGGNPAFQFSYLSYFEGLALNQFRSLIKFNSLDYYGQNTMEHFLGFSIKNFSSSDDERDLIKATNTGSFSIKNQSFAVFYAVQIKKMYVGIRAKSIYEKISDFSSRGFVFDTGALMRLNDILSFGCSLPNVGKELDSGKVPVNFRVGVSGSLPSFLIVADFDKVWEEKASLGCGIEYRTDFLSLRTGVKFQDFLKPSAGFGFVYGKLLFDYAYSFHKYLGGSHFFTVSLNF